MFTMYAKEGQTNCSNCGSAFEPDGLPNAIGMCSVSCPNPECNRGSWFQLKENRDYCVPVRVGLPALPIPISWNELPAACLGAYQMGLNPLPKLREALGISVRYFIEGTAYSAVNPTLAVWVGYDETESPDHVRIELHIADRVVWSAETHSPYMHFNEKAGPAFLQNDETWVSHPETYWSKDILQDHSRNCPHPKCAAFRLLEIP